MEVTIKLKAFELNSTLIQSLRKFMRKDQDVDITIHYTDKMREDFLKPETHEEYFANLDKAIEDVKKGNVISFTPDEFKKLNKKLLASK